MSRPGLADPRLTKAQGGSTQAGFPGGVATPPGKLRLSYDFFRLLGHKGAAIRDLKVPDSGGGWIASSLVYKDR